ncbi:LCP family protein required for cell wall assembly [Kitasatospora gansuensis]|uniref:LCP family protein required for cell wall assembly n=1 Tax=Kitasatospora gansuensis TaxID=258050 RepID=A0A7W7WLX4_9ACTN|nr:LCP family protein [Kitasatospora gansuensis]MBB4951540.1 LCP family protein required for cell wall assembly [Kitasatospora gansuensis]
MPNDEPTPGGRAAARQAAKKRGQRRPKTRPRWVVPTLLTAGAVLLAGCGGAFLYLRHLDSNIQSDRLGAGNAPPPPGQADANGRVAMNILIIGTDSRKGLGGGYGDRQNIGLGNNDVNIVLHVYPDKRAAVALDLPRDSLIDIPKCTSKDGKVSPAVTHVPLNDAMSRGGPGCVQDTVQALTGLKIDSWVLVNFQGVKDLTDAVGGVDVNLCSPVDDSGSHLDIPAGPVKLTGEQGLQFVRTRHAVGDGTAIGRFSMQRAYLSSLLRKLTDKGTLLDPTKAFPVIEAATKSLTVSENIAGTTKLVSLATDLKNVKPSEVEFVQPPTAFTHDDPNPNYKEKNKLVNPGARDLFTLIRLDKPLSGGEDHSGGQPTAPAPSAPAPPVVDPATVSVTVLNSTAQKGLATSTAETLARLKYKAEAGTGAPKNVTTSTVRHARADQKDAALAIARALGLPESAVVAGGPGTGVVVTLGADYRPTATSPTAAPVPTAVPSDVAVHQADETGCTKVK